MSISFILRVLSHVFINCHQNFFLVSRYYHCGCFKLWLSWGSERLRPMSCAIHQFFINLEPQEFKQSYKENLEWTGCIDRFINCFSLLKSSHPADHNLCLLLLTSSLEHALGDVYLSYSGAKQCPSLLKDLLTTQELKEVFGDAVITLLHILIGPPTSLNLRNVL